MFSGLNSANAEVSYDLSTQEVIDAFNNVYPGSKGNHEILKDQIEGLNEQGCLLDNSDGSNSKKPNSEKELTMASLPTLSMLKDYQAILDTIAEGMKQHYRENGSEPLSILEAGCGSKWDLNTSEIDFTLTGVDIYERDMEIRKAKKKDLDIAIVGDLRTVSLDQNAYDIIYNAYVLEHIAGAEQVLDNFVTWLKPGGKMFLIFPDRDTCYAFYTRLTPLWFHVFFKKYIAGHKNAGSPGMGPFPVFYDKVVSRKGMRDYCNANGLNIRAEYGTPGYVRQRTLRAAAVNALIWLTSAISFGRLDANHAGLVYVIEKPRLEEE